MEDIVEARAMTTMEAASTGDRIRSGLKLEGAPTIMGPPWGILGTTGTTSRPSTNTGILGTTNPLAALHRLKKKRRGPKFMSKPRNLLRK